ncbi:rna-directed dna polymerase from mobile element jockey-like [Willisornis vidua]|uniref:Rna-directed dna polymerase from mobile element jockey-like n=1 Tax=Willisornis vidua TaxID=1566151 RepID=A0ABQ9DI64_9PASS|nr:rna-directed dna polymerase from mobile element jockey-like [Willisornis vidua]
MKTYRRQLIRDRQQSFTKCELCLTNLDTLYGRVTVSVDKGRSTDIIYLDISDAFDTVNIFAAKLERYRTYVIIIKIRPKQRFDMKYFKRIRTIHV